MFDNAIIPLQLQIIFLIIFTGAALHYFHFLNTIFNGLKNVFENNGTENDHTYPVTVIIPFRNEAENILNCYGSIANQDYPEEKLEVIFVDDNSSDESSALLRSAVKKNNFKIISLPGSFESAHKKRAVNEALKIANGEIILTTDADCIHNKSWISSTVKYFTGNTGMVSGPVEFINNKNIFQKLQAVEFRGLILSGAGLIGSSRPIICNGANLAFKKNVFFEAGGYAGNMKLSSGDDELLMQKISRQNKYRIKFCPDKESVVSTNSNKSLKEFYNQRKRWASKSLFYSDKILIAKLILIFIFYIGLFFQLLLAAFVNELFIITFLSSLAGKIIFEYRVIYFGKKIFSESSTRLFLAAQIFHAPYIIISSMAGIFGNLKWKGRSIKR
jgi:cellulose synthase/poly-beta-1,6-N-acetylglucosamine synthase-like glycosyltransferase